MNYQLLRRLLFKLDPEQAHQLSLKALKYFYPSVIKRQFSSKPVKVWGLNFPNPIGLAAGYDKNGDSIDGLWNLGFGFVEVGTVTPRAQPGNPKPRVFRIPEAEALINRMGFNNKGVDYLVSKLCLRKSPGIVGVNIGKNFDTPLERAVEDYACCFKKVYPYADYITVNVSSPNTPGLRNLQNKEYLQTLLGELSTLRRELSLSHSHKKVPVLVKLTVDLDVSELFDALETIVHFAMDGVICSNTTLDHSSVFHFPNGKETGGLSGKPLFEKSHKMVDAVYKHLQGRLPIVAVGGIFSSDDALKMFDAGASLIQLYTGLIYRGPSLIPEILKVL